MYFTPKASLIILATAATLTLSSCVESAKKAVAEQKQTEQPKPLPTTTQPAKPEPTGSEDYLFDVKASKVLWKGYKLSGKPHTGTVNVSEGGFEVSEGKITMASVVIDLASIKDTDLKDPKMASKIENHLKSQDFFFVNQYRSAKLNVMDISDMPEDSEGNNMLIIGELSIRQASRPIKFPAKVTITGDKITALGTLSIDRTEYGIRYGSDKFLGYVADQIIKDNFELTFDLVANKGK
jgi:polyisoprenoid-binding protein YceI